MREYIIMADESVIQDAYVVKLTEDNIAIYIAGDHTVQELTNIFSKKSKTSKMTMHQNLTVYDWIGFTELRAVQINETDACVCLRKPL